MPKGNESQMDKKEFKNGDKKAAKFSHQPIRRLRTAQWGRAELAPAHVGDAHWSCTLPRWEMGGLCLSRLGFRVCAQPRMRLSSNHWRNRSARVRGSAAAAWGCGRGSM